MNIFRSILNAWNLWQPKSIYDVRFPYKTPEEEGAAEATYRARYDAAYRAAYYAVLEDKETKETQS